MLPLAKLVGQLCHAGLRIEEGTAKFYLDVADGNLKEAIALYGEVCSILCGAFKIVQPGSVLCHNISVCGFVQGRAWFVLAEQDMAWEQANNGKRRSS